MQNLPTIWPQIISEEKSQNKAFKKAQTGMDGIPADFYQTFTTTLSFLCLHVRMENYEEVNKKD